MQTALYNAEAIMLPDQIITCAGVHEVSPLAFMTPFGLMWSPSSLFMPFHNEICRAPEGEEGVAYLKGIYTRHEGLKGLLIRGEDSWVELFFMYNDAIYIQNSTLESNMIGIKTKVLAADTAETDAYNAIHGKADISDVLKAVRENSMHAHCSYTTISRKQMGTLLGKLKLRKFPG